MGRWTGIGSVVALVMVLVLATAGNSLAHCDGLDGPVVNLARQALAKGDVKIVLPWVAADKEAEIQKAFDLAVAVRGKGDTVNLRSDDIVRGLAQAVNANGVAGRINENAFFLDPSKFSDLSRNRVIVLNGTGIALRNLGHPVDINAGIKAAQQVLGIS